LTPQEPFTQIVPTAQWGSAVQVLRHAAFCGSQVNGAQGMVVRTQVPMPLHLAAVVKMPSRQSATPQVVPVG
jgi:hypothetical protein